MNDFFEKTFWHNTVADWAFALGGVLVCYIGAKILLWITNKFAKKYTEKTKTQLDDLLIDMLEEPIAVAITLGGFFWAVGYLNIPNPSIENIANKFLTFLLVVDLTWLVARTADALLTTYLVPITEKTDSAFDDQLVPIVQKGIKAVIWILGIILALDNLNVDIGAMIAGLGIGGLALALAAQDAVKNVFGGVMIFIDKPFKINDRIQVHGYDGTVEEVGLRSTRIRTLEGRKVTMPNSLFMDNEVTNVTSEPTRKIMLNLGLTYNTNAENIQKALDILGEITIKNSDIIDENTPKAFTTFGDFSLGITYIYFIRKEADIMLTQTKIHLDILTAFNENGLEFAYPTQTIYKKDI
ncbi:MAG: mechanosensitive ion channel family protein [Flavobacteriales bacterium]|nr:mechanosensitive ion channel family protein [Flavobacteriales bacterium]MCB9198304.1 mechanosensitive ion channel family protein [Flavobacteriales bacterium]